MNDPRAAKRYWGLLAAWTLLNLLQAAFTDLWHDEAYYWMYAQHLDWGYFDHPPMIALWIKAGYTLFHNELGVRLLIVLANTAMVAGVWHIADPQPAQDMPRTVLFWAIVAAIAPIQLAGYLAVPDAPLLFFTVIFFLLYKKYLSENTPLQALLLTLCIAAMLYSKYHGIIVVGLTVLSNGALWRRASFYGIAIGAAALMLPHLWWQYSHDFPSVHYHLTDRSAAPYSPLFTLKYLAGQLLLAGPIVAIPLLWLAATYRPQDVFERALKWNFIGTLAFFGLMSFKGEVEPNWTFIAFVPMIVLAYRALCAADTASRWLHWVWRTLPISLALIFVVRIYFVHDFLPKTWLLRHEYHKQREWAAAIAKVAGNAPVVFYDSYQNAAKYTFYTGNFAHSMSSYHSRASQYDLWQYEKNLQGKSVIVSANWIERDKSLLRLPYGDTMSYFSAPRFFSYGRVKIEPQMNEWRVKRGTKTLDIPLKVIFPESEKPTWAHALSAPELFYRIARGRDELTNASAGRAMESFPLNTFSPVTIQLPQEAGEYSLRFGIATDWRVPTLNTRSIPLIIE